MKARQEANAKRSNDPRTFLSDQEVALIEESVSEAESHTSAQIKFVMCRHCWGSIRDKAIHLCRKLGLHKTAQRNCVLILLVTANREFCIYGDVGIHEKAGQQTWEEVRDTMAAKFRDDDFAGGLCDGIGMIGQKLAEYFPHKDGGYNEIPYAVDYEE